MDRADDDAAVVAARDHLRRDGRRRILIGDRRGAARRLWEDAGHGEPGHSNGDGDRSGDAGKRVARKWQRASGGTLNLNVAMRSALLNPGAVRM